MCYTIRCKNNHVTFSFVNTACQSNPCQHNGTCIAGINADMCNCMPGFTGAQCETSKIIGLDSIAVIRCILCSSCSMFSVSDNDFFSISEKRCTPGVAIRTRCPEDFPGMTPEQCAALYIDGTCCWDTTVPDVPWCYIPL